MNENDSKPDYCFFYFSFSRLFSYNTNGIEVLFSYKILNLLEYFSKIKNKRKPISSLGIGVTIKTSRTDSFTTVFYVPIRSEKI